MPEQAPSIHDSRIDPRNRDILISINGRMVPRAEASVSVFDSGFILGDGVWEGLRLVNGGIPFLRSVRHFERQRMTAVYRTFLDFSELIPAFLFSLALMWLPLGSVFVILAIGLLIIGGLSWRFLPRSM